MFGTGEWASSASESTIPSRTSSSWRSGTYWRQMGSPGDLIRSTIAGEMRNSKFTAACRSRSRSGKCSAPNLATSASREAMLRLRRSSCQDSIRQILEIDHQVVVGRVVARHGGAPGVAAPLVERARRCVLRQGGCLHDHEPAAVADQPMLNRLDQPGAHPAALPRRIHDEPVEVVGAGRPGRGAPAGVADELVTLVGAEEAVVAVAGERVVQQLDGDRHLVLAEEAGRARQPLKPCAVRGFYGTERAAHAPPWPPAPRGAPPRQSGGPAPRNPSRPPAPCATGRRRRLGRDSGSRRPPSAGP